MIEFIAINAEKMICKVNEMQLQPNFSKLTANEYGIKQPKRAPIIITNVLCGFSSFVILCHDVFR